jgi:hypothetical protein
MTEATNQPAVAFRVKAHVTLPLLKIEDDKQYAITIETPFKKGEAAPARKMKEEYTDPETGELKVRETMSKPQEPPVLCQVTNLYTGERAQMIAGAVFHSEITKQYPNDTYVGRSFQFTVQKASGKRYKVPMISEVEVEKPAAEDAGAAEKPKAAKAK